MRLATFNAGVPVFAVRSEIEHVTPRVPTVFEKMVLRLVEAAQGQGALGAISLRAAFEDMLGMADAPRLLGPCTGELCMLQVLVEPDAKDPLDAPLSTWQLTAQGRDFWRRGLLPRRASYEKVMHGYEPISGELGSWHDGAVGEQLPPACLDGTAPDLDFGPLVREALQRQRPAWLKSSTEVTSVQAGVADTRWRTVALQLDVADDGTLALRATSDDAFNAWLRSAQPELVWERLVAPALGGSLAQAGRGVPALNLAGTVAVSLAMQAATDERTAPARKCWPLIVLAGDEPPHGVPAQAADVVSLRRPFSRLMGWWAQETEVPQPPEGGIAVQLDVPHGLPPGLRRIELRAPGAAPQAWAEGVATLYWGGQGRQVHLRAELAPEQAQAAWAMVSGALGDWLATQSRPGAIPMGAWCESIEPALAQWLRQTTTLGWSDWLDELAALLTRLQQRLDMSPDVLTRQPWMAALKERCAGIVDRIGSVLTLSEGIELLEALRRVPLRQHALARVVLERVTPRERLADVERLRQALGDESIVLPASLMDVPVRKALLRAALAVGGGEGPPGVGRHELEERLRTFSQAYWQARRGMPAALLDQPAQSSPEWQRALRVQPARTLAAIAALELAVSDVLAALDLPQDALVTPLDRLPMLRQEMAARLAPPLPAGQRAVVIDTNVLLDVPDLFERMSAQDQPIVARAVIEELDGLKQPPSCADPEEQSKAQQKAQHARRASRALEAASCRVVFEPPRRDQCAADLPATRDSEILAVAAYYALSPVLLLTSDRLLRMTAKGESVSAQTPQDYLKTLGRPQAPAQPARDRSTVR